MSTVAPDGRNQQELRLALAMRGGASMAVWIGGAVAEINHLRTALTPPEQEPVADDARAAAPFGRKVRTPHKQARVDTEVPEKATQERSSEDRGVERTATQATTGSDGASTPTDLGKETASLTVEHSAQAVSAGGDGGSLVGDPAETELSDPPHEPKADGAGTTEDSPRPTMLDEHPWAVLARLAGYDSVAVDVLAGASAGGLNATLLSTSLVYGMPFDRMRSTWVRLADLEAMSRPVPMFWDRKPMSLLEGDAYFRAELAEVLDDAESVEPSRAERADLLLTATLLDPVVERRFDAGSTPITEERRRAWFRFRHRGEPGDPLSDFAAGTARKRTARELAQAARSTSSYPFAFEPAQVHSRPGEPPLGEPNMFGAFSEVAVPPEHRPFRVMDGGVLDNIPVAAAIHSIASTVADRPSERFLLYLNPDPESPTGEREGSRLAFPVASTAMRARMTQESLLADIEALDEHNSAVERTALRRKALFAQISAVEPAQRPDELRRVVETVRDDHAVVRVELDALAFVRLLTDPAGSEDGRLLPPVVGDPLQGWSAAAVSALPDALSRRLAGEAEPNAVFGDVRGFLSAVEECLGWTHDLECDATGEAAREVARCKAALYRLRVFGEVLEGHADRYWVHGAQLEPIVDPAELNTWVGRVADRRRRLQHALPSPVRPLLGAVLSEIEQGERLVGESFQRPLGDFAAELLSIVESSGADAAAEDTPGHVDAVAEASGVLDRLLARLAFVAPTRTEFRFPEQIGYGMLESAAADDRIDVLRRVVVLTAPLDVGRAPGSRIRLMRVRSDASSPLPFEALRRDGELRVEDKVRGGDLGNFGAFLSARWRANDWMWGRMDAVPTLVDMLCDPARLRIHNEAAGAAGVFEELRVLACTPSPEELRGAGEGVAGKWRGFLTERWEHRAEDVRSELATAFAEPDGDHPLPATRAAVTERLQWMIAASELPFVHEVSQGAEPDLPEREPQPLPSPRRVSAQVERYSVGAQRVPDLGERRVAGMATRFALLAHRAVRPGRSSVWAWLGRGAIMLLKPFVVIAAFAVAAPVRAATVGLLGSMAAASAAPLATFSGDEGWDDSGVSGLVPITFAGSGVGVATVLAWVVSGVFALWLGVVGSGRVRFGRGGGGQSAQNEAPSRRDGQLSGGLRWTFATLLAAVPLGLVAVMWANGFRLRPLGLLLVAIGLTWLATFAYKASGRVAATVVGGLVFGATTWAFADGFLTPWATASWLGWTILVTAYAHAILLSAVDLLPPRPRTDPLSTTS
ncbi:patatin-like protein [Allosaccharopolyspora coralli]|uniref:Patatin-like protein n=1 Tax=Allosaccharopolyspora coralli TaxID=2665642 RepID=A0A5Q3Q6U6_9PSEU|nr:patatin-like protein [Allosaccharopolyspora coralli]QGK68884.1 patatin-like protein [Allosaccharopolyspora coralli]